MQSTQQPNSQHKKRFRIGGLVFSLFVITTIFVVWLNKDYLADSVRFWQFQPSPAIEQIASRTDLTDAGKFAFFAAQPIVASGDSFNAACDQHQEHSAVLGCYTNNKIYIYDVTDSRLSGIKEVTAAHEMLHAVYQRMDDEQKASINKLLEAEYDKLKTMPSYAERMAYYARTEPGQRDNELHSIIGTEVTDISPALETYYKKYFSDRTKITAFHTAYNSTFTELEAKQRQLGSQLDALSADIEQDSSSYNADSKTLSADIDTFNQKATSGGFANRAEFDKERQSLVARSTKLASQRNTINENVERYNKLRDEYNDSITQSNELYRSMDSTLNPAPKV